MQRSSLLFFVLLFVNHLLFAQRPYHNERPEFLKANSVWAFGYRAGLDFNSGKPVPIKTQKEADGKMAEGGTAVSDRVTGKLLFYSDGGRVWNANHKIMPNGDMLLGNSMYINDTLWQLSTRQGVCIVPVIGDSSKYYLFSLSGMTSGGAKPEGSLFYNIVDMKLDNGLGDIVPGKKNIPLDREELTEGVIAVPGDNCDDIWLIVHHKKKHEFRAYHITADGIDTTPVISNTNTGLSDYGMNTLAISPDRSKIAVPSMAGGVLLAEFDPATGRFSNHIVVNKNFNPLGACFSPDNTKLYITIDAKARAGIGQLDLTVYDSATIVNSFTKVSDMGSDPIVLYNDTIYFTKEGPTDTPKNYIHRINKPNLPGAACDVQENAIKLLDSTGIGKGPSLHNDVVFPLQNTVYATFDSLVCTDFTLNAPDGFEEYRWEDGSTALNRTVTKPGTYWVVSKDFCNTRIDTFNISGLDLTHPVINVEKRRLGTVASYYTYQWMLNGKLIQGATDSTYTVTENGNYQVIVSSEEGCVDTSDIYKVTNAEEPNYIGDIDALAKNISIFPNPLKDVLHIDAPLEVSVNIYSMEGKLIKKVETAKEINVATLSSGLYFLKIHDSKGRLLKSEKIVK